MISNLRGHKHSCFWRNCPCSECTIVSERQRVTAARIALYRQFNVKKPVMVNNVHSTPEEDQASTSAVQEFDQSMHERTGEFSAGRSDERG